MDSTAEPNSYSAIFQENNSRIQSKIGEYDVKSAKCIVFHNTKFDRPPKENVGDTEENDVTDVDAIKATFSNEQVFQGKICPNYTLRAIKTEIKNAFAEDFSSYGSLCVFFLTYGTGTAKLRAKDQDYYLEDVVKFAMESTGQSIVGKPKVFIVQAPAMVVDEDQKLIPPKDEGAAQVNMPTSADLLMAFAGKPGSFTFREPEKTFVKVLCDVIAQHGGESDFETMVEYTGTMIEDNICKFDENVFGQPKPVLVSTLTKALFLREQNSPSLASLRQKMEIYPRNKRRYVIFNFTFAGTNLVRKGTDSDVVKVVETLNGLGFEGEEPYHDLDRPEIGNKLRKAINSDFDSLFVFIFTHGLEDYMLLASDGLYKFQELVNEAVNSVTETLVGRPIAFIIQACSGEKLDEGTRYADLNKAESSGTPLFLPLMPDLLLAFASAPGYASLRNTKTGSSFIQNLCETIEDVPGGDLMEILTITKHKVAEKVVRVLPVVPMVPRPDEDSEIECLDAQPTTIGDPRKPIAVKQIPIVISTLTKRFQF